MDQYHQFVKECVEKYRKKLLDTSKRNNLINFSHSERSRQHIRVIDELPDFLYTQLLEGKTLTFEALPEEDEVPIDECTDEFKGLLEQGKLTDEDYIQAIDEIDEDDENAIDETKKIERVLRNKIRQQLGLSILTDQKRLSNIEVAKKHGINPSYEMPLVSVDTSEKTKRHADKYIQTLLKPEEMTRTLSGLTSYIKTDIDETGVNTLYVAFGFLHWYEAENSNKACTSPLLLLQLEIKKELSKKGYLFKVQSTGEKTEVNLSLGERLKKDFGIQIPEFGDDDTPEIYMQKVSEIISDAKVPKKQQWKVKRYITAGRFRFSQLVMFHDLNPDKWPNGSGAASNNVIQTLFSGTKENDGGDLAEDYNVDTEEVESAVPVLITSADASQHSAIKDVMGGKNLAIKGPPGTGKSQTITNIIANALATGKTVLFLAEKMAALNVVHERLNKAGLGPFCLELHSTKAQKTKILKSLEERIFHMPPKLTADIAAKVREFKKHRVHLSEYIDILNSTFAAQRLSIHQYLWAVQLRSSRISMLPSSIRQVSVPFVQADLTDTQMSAHLEEIQLLIKLNNEVKEDSGDGTHPWHFIQDINLTPFQRDEFVDRVASWKAGIKKLDETAQEIERNYGVNFEHSIDGLTNYKLSTQKICETDTDKLDISIFDKLSSPVEALQLIEFVEAVEKFNTLASEIRSVKNIEYAVQNLNVLDQLLKEAEDSNVVDVTISDIKSLISELQGLATFLLGNFQTILETAKPFGVTANDNFDKIYDFIELPDVVARIPREYLVHRSKDVMDETNSSMLRMAHDITTQLKKSLSLINETTDISLFGEASETRTYAAIIESAGLFRIFDSSYRKAKRIYKLSQKVNQKFDRKHCAATLRSIATAKEQVKKLEDDHHLKNVCGIHFKGIDTNFEILLQVNEWAASVRAKFAGTKEFTRNLRNKLLHGEVEELDILRELAASEDFKEFKEQLSKTKSNISLEISIEKYVTQINERIAALTSIVDGLKNHLSTDDILLSQLQSELSLLRQVSTIKSKISNLSGVPIILGSKFHGLATQVETIKSTVSFLATFLQTATLKHNFGKFITSNFNSTWREYVQIRQQTVDLLNKSVSISADISQFGNINFVSATQDGKWTNIVFSTLLQILDRALSNQASLNRWMQYSSQLARAEVTVKGPLIAAYLDNDVDFDTMPTAFEYVIYNAIAKEIYNIYPQLKNYSGYSLSQARERLKELDQEIVSLQQISLNRDLTSARVLPGNNQGSRKTWTEGPLIQNEITKQKQHIPTRDLLQRAGKSIQKIKPCFMMSPMTVAQYLQPGKFEFDLIVIDEASQMCPEDALGSIARGKQIVVVGDPQQLPPTNFFKQSAKDDEYEPEDLKSDAIMDLALSAFRPARILSRHYRSQHESLIEFSNYHFYDNNLLLFPSPVKNPDELGVQLKYVEGTYSSSSNLTEVKAITQAALDFMRRYPDRSLGIATMNQVQAELIDAEMDKAFIDNPHAASYKARWKESLEEFFVKNLESVQGDERDAIFISTVYGPDKDKVVRQSFGPINNPGGYRRLNVLFTRAKKNMWVFTSLKPEDIKISPGSSEGLKAFKGFLSYASQGILDGGNLSNSEPDSDFEIWVKERLEAIGCEVHPQVGVAGYKIDLGIKHPKYPYGYLLGVECDGATYHSSKSARERDIIRQQILENLGWNIYRIWSTDWFSQPQQEFERLKIHIENLLQNVPKHQTLA